MGLPENIDALLVKFDINQDALARVAGVSPSSVTRWRQGAQIRKESINRICKYFGLAEDDLLSDSYGLAAKEHGSANFVPVTALGEATIPLMTLGRVHAGPFTDEEETERSVEVPASLLRNHPNARALLVEGDCMDRVVPEGMAVVFDPDKEPTNGSIVIVEADGYRALMRRWYRGGSTLMLVADSHGSYEDIVLTEDDGPVRVVGTVIWAQSSKEME
uniref:LexA family protein n=1 Tax=Olsenella uli TaxID=133926 RepID=UPI0028E870DB|nr:S24 family peptidase [Olsenella uli]